MAQSRRKQNSDITRIVGILFLEALAAIALFSLAGVAREQRSQIDSTEALQAPEITLVQHIEPERYSYPQPFNFESEKSLPKVALGRYNARR